MLTLQESFNNVRVTCDNVREPGLNNAERQAVNESLKNIADALQAYEATLQASEPQLEDESDEDNS